MRAHGALLPISWLWTFRHELNSTPPDRQRRVLTPSKLESRRRYKGANAARARRFVCHRNCLSGVPEARIEAPS